MNTLEFLVNFGGMVQLEGEYNCTTETTRQNDPVVDHSRLENRGYVVRKPHVSSEKANLNLTGLDTTTRKDDKSYGFRSLVVSSNFQLLHPIRYNAGGWKVKTREDFDTIFPQIPTNKVDWFVTLLAEFKVCQDFVKKAKSKLPKTIREESEKSEMFRVENPVQKWAINPVVDIPRYSWKNYQTSDIIEMISEKTVRMEGIKDEIIDATGYIYLSSMDAHEVVRAIELGILETGLLVAIGKPELIKMEETVEPSYVTKDEFETLIAKGKIAVENYIGRDGTPKVKGIVKEAKVDFIDIPVPVVIAV